MELLRKNLITYTTMALLLCWAILATRQCSTNKGNYNNLMDNVAILNDTLVEYREVNGKMYAENRVASLRINELQLLDSSRLQEIKSLTGKLKKLKSDTRIRVVYDTVEVAAPIEHSTFRHEDNCLWVFGVIDSSDVYLTYTIKPQEISITQYRKGNEIIAAASINGCGTVESMSSIIIEEPKKKWHDTAMAKVGFAILLGVAIIL
jgi:hypothetical protein